MNTSRRILIAAIGVFVFAPHGFSQDVPLNNDVCIRSLSSWMQLQNDGSAKLFVRLSLAKNWECYSLTQPKGGPLPTSIRIESITGNPIEVSFSSFPSPKVKKTKAWSDLDLETHKNVVLWAATIPSEDVVKLSKQSAAVLIGTLHAVFENHVEPSALVRTKCFAATFESKQKRAGI